MIRIDYPNSPGGMRTVRRAARRPRLSIHAGCGQVQGGTIAIMFAGLLVVIIGFCGLALDLSQVYNRGFEMHNVADMAALAAARELDGTPGGIDRAISAAASTIGAADGLKYQYGKQKMTWSNTAIKFSTSPDRQGQWVDAGTARGAPGGVLYVMVSTGELDPAYGEVDTIFMRVLSPTRKKASVQSDAVAGRSAINVTPLAICAMSSNPAFSRPNAAGFEELVEYGFRRGVSYDLMQLNPNNTTPAVNFVVNPIAPPGTTVSSAMDAAAVGPYVCSGTMAMPRVIGAPITVAQSFPINNLFNQLNSRFDKYVGGLCNPSSAPPDSNVRPYVNSSNISWMGAAPNGQTAQSTTSGGKLWTVADPSPPPGGTIAKMYGPLWTYARAVPFSSYTGAAEPVGGYLPFVATNQVWSKLYSPGPTVGSYPSPSGTKTPYQANVNSAPPSAIHGLGVPNRRVLNVPLLACPGPTAPTTSATVLAIGRFFMTVPADAYSIYAEFAGAVSDEFVKGPVELYP